jgi:sigma-B regulation protein RsbU (phosphoserine phosphatase)
LLQLDNTGLILRINDTLCAWLGCSARDLVGAGRLRDLLAADGSAPPSNDVLALHVPGVVSAGKVRLRGANGGALTVVFNARRRLQEGVALDDVAFFRAEGAKADDLAEFARQLMGIVSHDLRNPLSAIGLSAQVLLRTPLDDAQAQAVARIRTANARANRLIGDMLDFTQARLGGGIPVTMRALSLHALVQDCLQGWSSDYPDRELAHQQSGEGDCDGDADRLAQMVGSLVGNALAYGDASRPVSVSSTIDTNAFCLSVHNYGEPIAETLIGSLFSPLGRGPGVRTSGRSVGLGLYIAREIAAAHGGIVSAESNAQGTTFRATLPRRAGGAVTPG